MKKFIDFVHDYIKLYLAFDKIIPYLIHFLLFIKCSNSGFDQQLLIVN